MTPPHTHTPTRSLTLALPHYLSVFLSHTLYLYLPPAIFLSHKHTPELTELNM